MFRCLLTVVCCLLSFYLHALEVKDFTFSHLGKTEGLDNQRIFSIRQTETGAIWWSSMTGVGRYNGLRVKNYPLDKGTPYGHMGGRVINLTTDNGRCEEKNNQFFCFAPSLRQTCTEALCQRDSTPCIPFSFSFSYFC